MKRARENTFCEFTSLHKLKVNKGGKIAFVSMRPDEHKNAYIQELCLYGRDGLKQNIAPFAIINEFIWLDETMLMVNAVSEDEQIKCVDGSVPFSILYTVDSISGMVREYARMPYTIVSFKAIGDGRLVMSVRIDPEAQALYERLGEDLPAYAQAYQHVTECFTATEIPFCQEGEGFTGGKRTVLGIFQSGVLTELTSRKETVCGFDVFEDELIVFIVSEFDSVKRDEARIGCYNLKSGKMISGTEQTAKFYATVKAIDRSKYVATCTDGKLHGIYQDLSLEIKDIAANKEVLLNAEGELSLFSSVNTDIYHSSEHYIDLCVEGDNIYFVATQHDSSHVFRANYKTKQITQITHDQGLVKGIAVYRDKLYLIGAKDMSGFELYCLDVNTGSVTQITHFNGHNQTPLWVSRPQEISFRHSEGHDIFGWVMKPKEFSPDMKYPAILSIHGGPNTAYGPNYIHELQFLASNGYAVFYCNPRGSVGRGGAFMDIRGKYFAADVSDLLEFTEYVLSATPWIDREKLGVIGGSYGGILTAWLAGHNTHFEAAVTERTATNLISYFGTSAIGSQWMQDTFFATPWPDIEKYWDSSPLKYAPSVDIPVLFIQADLDCICPPSNALEFYHALKFFKKKSKLVLFMGEDHSLKVAGSPRARIRRLKEIVGWFDKYLK